MSEQTNSQTTETAHDAAVTSDQTGDDAAMGSVAGVAPADEATAEAVTDKPVAPEIVIPLPATRVDSVDSVSEDSAHTAETATQSDAAVGVDASGTSAAAAEATGDPSDASAQEIAMAALDPRKITSSVDAGQSKGAVTDSTSGASDDSSQAASLKSEPSTPSTDATVTSARDPSSSRIVGPTSNRRANDAQHFVLTLTHSGAAVARYTGDGPRVTVERIAAAFRAARHPILPIFVVIKAEIERPSGIVKSTLRPLLAEGRQLISR